MATSKARNPFMLGKENELPLENTKFSPLFWRRLNFCLHLSTMHSQYQLRKIFSNWVYKYLKKNVWLRAKVSNFKYINDIKIVWSNQSYIFLYNGHSTSLIYHKCVLLFSLSSIFFFFFCYTIFLINLLTTYFFLFFFSFFLRIKRYGKLSIVSHYLYWYITIFVRIYSKGWRLQVFAIPLQKLYPNVLSSSSPAIRSNNVCITRITNFYKQLISCLYLFLFSTKNVILVN